MIAVINAGGSGSRLWPLSTPDYPKHLLKIGNNGHTLMQAAYDRVNGFADDIYVITEQGHAKHVTDQLPDLDKEHVIIEPARRGTASCLLLALDHIGERHGDDEPLVFMHADHVIRDVDGFRATVKHAAEVSVKEGSMVLLGVEPSFPSTGFGYIKKGPLVSSSGAREVFKIDSFKEKPDRVTAEKFVRDGHYLWNMGYFAAPLKVFVETMKQDAPKLHEGYNVLKDASDKQEAYLGLEDDAIDYALIEKATNLLVVPGTFDWMDVGNFQDLHTVEQHDDDGNAISGEFATELVTNSYLHNDTDQKIAVIGLDNVAVVATEHGLVVTNRNHAHKVGDVSKKLNRNDS